MLWNVGGIDFLRVQRTSKTLVADPIADEVLFSGAYRDLCLFRQVNVASSSNVSNNTYSVSFGRTFTYPPLVLGVLKLTSNYTDQQGNTAFVAGDLVAPILNTLDQNNQPVRKMIFTYTAKTTGIDLRVAGFNGVVTFLIFELD